MLPYSPIHHLLLAPVPGGDAQVPDALVLTSANRSDEPICFTEDDAAKRLADLCDAVLDHNRPIHVPCDDSVVRVIRDREEARELPIRRSRGYAPLPVNLGQDGPPVLAVGGELKNTFCLTDGARAYMSGHIGDMGTLETMLAFESAVQQLSQIRCKPVRLAADLHPGYHTRNWAEREAGDRPLDLVQHHHAHVCRCWPSTAASANRSSESPSTAPVTAAIRRSGAGRFSRSGPTATVSCGPAT